VAATGGSSRAGGVGVLIARQLGLGGRLGVVIVDVTAGTCGTNSAGGGTDIEAVPERARSAFLVAAAAGSVCGVGRPRRCPRVGKGVGCWPGWAAACRAGRLAAPVGPRRVGAGATWGRLGRGRKQAGWRGKLGHSQKRGVASWAVACRTSRLAAPVGPRRDGAGATWGRLGRGRKRAGWRGKLGHGQKRGVASWAAACWAKRRRGLDWSCLGQIWLFYFLFLFFQINQGSYIVYVCRQLVHFLVGSTRGQLG